MDGPTLESLDSSLIAECLTLWIKIKAWQAKIDVAKQRITDAQRTVQRIQNGEPIASELAVLFDVEEALRTVAPKLQEALGFDPVELYDKLNKVESFLQNPQDLLVEHIEELGVIVELYAVIESTQNKAEFVKNFLVNEFEEWLKRDVKFASLGVTLRFVTQINDSPFRKNANLTAQVIYEGGFRVDVKGIYLIFDDATNRVEPFIDWDQAAVVPNIASTAADILANALKEIDLPLPVKIDRVDIVTTEKPWALKLATSFSGIPGYDSLKFRVDLRVQSNGKVTATGGASVRLPAIVPIPGTVFVFDGYEIGYFQSPSRARLSTDIVPLQPTLGSVLKLTVGVSVPLAKPGEGIGFNGDLLFLGSPIAQITGRNGEPEGKISPGEISARMSMPNTGGKSPFGTEKVLKLDSDFILDEIGFRTTGKVDIFSGAFTGDMNADIGFNGFGNVYVNTKVKSLKADSTLTANWKPGFKDLVVASTATASVKVGGLKKEVKFVAQVDGELLPNDILSVKFSSKVLGVKIDDKFELSLTSPRYSLEQLIERKLDQQQDSWEELYKGASKLVAELDVQNRNSALRKAIASLDVFRRNSEAVQEVQRIPSTVDDAFAKISQVASITNWKLPFKNQSFLSMGGAGTLSAGDLTKINTLRDNLLELANAIDGLSFHEKFPETETSTVGDANPTRSEFSIDASETLIALGDIVSTGFKQAVITFLLTGSSYTIQKGIRHTGNFSEWCGIEVREVHPHGQWATIHIPKFLTDSSILFPRHHVYGKIKQLVLAEIPGVHIGDTSTMDDTVDPNDPGVPPAVDPNVTPGTPPGNGNGGLNGEILPQPIPGIDNVIDL